MNTNTQNITFRNSNDYIYKLRLNYKDLVKGIRIDPEVYTYEKSSESLFTPNW